MPFPFLGPKAPNTNLFNKLALSKNTSNIKHHCKIRRQQILFKIFFLKNLKGQVIEKVMILTADK